MFTANVSHKTEGKMQKESAKSVMTVYFRAFGT